MLATPSQATKTARRKPARGVKAEEGPFHQGKERRKAAGPWEARRLLIQTAIKLTALSLDYVLLLNEHRDHHHYDVCYSIADYSTAGYFCDDYSTDDYSSDHYSEAV
jgi:hypothetical protein